MDDPDYLDRSAEAAVGALADEMAARLTAPTEALFGRQLERIDGLLKTGAGPATPARAADPAALRRLEVQLRENAQALRRSTASALAALPGQIRHELARELATLPERLRAEIEPRQAAAREALEARLLQASRDTAAQSAASLSEECDKLFQVQHDLLAHFDALQKAVGEQFVGLDQRLEAAEGTTTRTREDLLQFREQLTTMLADWSDRLGTYVDGLGPRLEKSHAAFAEETLLPEVEKRLAARTDSLQAELTALREANARMEARGKLIVGAALAAALFAAAGAVISILM